MHRRVFSEWISAAFLLRFATKLLQCAVIVQGFGAEGARAAGGLGMKGDLMKPRGS